MWSIVCVCVCVWKNQVHTGLNYVHQGRNLSVSAVKARLMVSTDAHASFGEKLRVHLIADEIARRVFEGLGWE